MDNYTKKNALRIVNQYKGIWDLPPVHIYEGDFTDAPLLGNGDAGVIIAGNIDSMTFILGKNEFISQSEGIPKAMSELLLKIPHMSGAAYHMEQEISRGEVNGIFGRGESKILTKSWVQATDTIHNLLITNITYEGRNDLDATIQFPWVSENTHLPMVDSMEDILYQDVKADAVDSVEGYDTPRARIATKVVGASESAVISNAVHFVLKPGTTATLVTCIMSIYDHPEYQRETVEKIHSVSPDDVEAMYRSHCTWWENFWSKSFVEIPDKVIEKEFYGSLYLLGSCMRQNETAPGLYGNWIMKNMKWGGLPPLNYNYEAPYYCTVPTNHVELAENYDKLILDWIPIAQKNAADHGYAGVLYEAYPGPLPYGSMFSGRRWTGLDFMGRDCYMCQKSNAVFAATNMIFRFYYTLDEEYAGKVYPFLKEVGEFWLDYMRWDGTRYVIDNDYVHEGPISIFPQTNPLTSLGMVRLLLQGLIDISKYLELDAELRSTWQDRSHKLSAFPTFIRNGQEVFKNQESGASSEWAKDSGADEDWSQWSTPGAIPEMGLMYPGGQIGILSDPQLLQTAKNTVAQQAKWQDDNMVCFFYPSAARVGHDPKEILKQLSQVVQKKTYPNMAYGFGGGGIENLNTVPATMVELLCQSFQGKLKVFANWPGHMDAGFGDFMAYGSFLVSSKIRNGKVQYLRIWSKKGQKLIFINPWPEAVLQVYRNGQGAESLSGKEIELPTFVDEMIHIGPEGISYNEILGRMS